MSALISKICLTRTELSSLFTVSSLISPPLRYWAARNTCPKCSYRWTNDLKGEVMKLRKVDFFWINREQRSFEWFISLLSQLEIEQAEQGGAMERFLDMHMYITSALQKTDMKAVGLQLALELLHEKVRLNVSPSLGMCQTCSMLPSGDSHSRLVSRPVSDPDTQIPMIPSR